MNTNLKISDKNILISWDDEQLTEIIFNMHSPWQCDCSVLDYEIKIEKSNQGYIVQLLMNKTKI